MINAELRKYLGYVLETERNVLILKNSTAKMSNTIQKLGTERNISKPKKEKSSETPEGTIYILLGALLVGALGGWIYSAITAEKGWFIFKLFYAKFSHIAIGAMILFVPVTIGFIIAAIMRRSRNKDKLRTYDNAKERERVRATNELSTKDNAIQYLNKTKAQLLATQQVLDKLYSLNIIHKDYRNIIAVASFYQYIEAGICTELEGHEGAYALYLHESWYRTLSAQLDNIIDKLDLIQENQTILLRAVKSANERIDKLIKVSEMTLSHTKATAQNSEIIAYNTEVAKRNTEFLAWMEIYKRR